MPGMQGTELAQRALALHPATAVVLMTGLEAIVGDLTWAGGRVTVLQKPLDRGRLSIAVRDGITLARAAPLATDPVAAGD
jgi:two-component system cell cycle sensor histidine kinase/response regulator CckA